MSNFDEEQPSLSLIGQNFALCQMLSKVESEEALYSSVDSILEEIAKNFEVDAVGFAIRKSHQPAFTSFLHDLHSFGMGQDEKKRLSFFLAQSVVPDILQRMRCVRREDVRFDILGDQAAGQRTKMVSMLCVPMFSGSEVIGVFVAFRSEISGFCVDDELLFQRIASLLGEDLEATSAYLRVARDPLTGFYNRRVFFEALLQETARARRYQAPLSTMMLDVDTLSPLAGESKKSVDLFLKKFSQRIFSETRQSDIIARASDTAFLFLQPMTTAKSSAEVAARIRDHFVHNPIVINEVPVSVVISVGISSLRSFDDDGAAMLMRADRAVNAAKKKGFNQIVVDHEQNDRN